MKLTLLLLMARILADDIKIATSSYALAFRTDLFY